jgi:predicted helicase
MACGTGKTFTALKITEHLTPEKGFVLFLVPSISLLSQTLREWTAEASTGLHSLAVCSDKKVGKKAADDEDINIHDLAFPATTNAHDLSKHIAAAKDKRTVIFSTIVN